MPTAIETKRGIENSLKSFADKPLVDAATALFESLGYKSQKRIVLKPNTAKTFTENFAKDKPLNPDHALLADWRSVDFLFQITDDEVRAAAQGNEQFLFESKGKWNGAAIESYLFFAITLTKPHYTRTELSGITRAVNRLFPMPAMLLFRHGDTLTLAIINRRLHKRDESKDVLEKVTLIKDIRFANPHRAHVEILSDLSFDALQQKHDFTNFVALHVAWQKALDSSELNKRFFLEIANWYFWALNYAKFPKDAPKQNGKDHISVIRLITRLMFCWFVKEKGLISDILFDERKLAQTLNGFAPSKTGDKESVFYKAILQNLFFATLNTEMDKRGWTKEEQNFMAHSLYRHRDFFQKPNDALDLFKNIPFLNGGLFECLDKDLGENAKPRYVRIDGFSRREDSQPIVPDFLFFGPEREVDLSEEYGDKKFKKVKVRGLIHTFDHYKFTVTENTPIEEEIALDPELSGKVFENLLAAYNPETGATARKQTGSFYTPREIVNYMVDEALIACLKTKLTAENAENTKTEGNQAEVFSSALSAFSAVEKKLRHLFAYNDQKHQFTPAEVDALIAAIDSLKSLDPAVGSGAFPMGILHKLVFILGKLDPRNEKWKERQIARVRDTMATAEKIEDATARERAVRELEQQIDGINEAFEHNELDYGRKLYLIENCIYGVDIQPIAVQIAKMRFFISLVVDQKIDDTQPNRGVRPLPNLETKFVAANTLIGVNRPGQQLLRNREIDAKEASLREVRRRHFLARSLTQKRKCREQDEKLRAEIAELLKGDGWDTATARRLADWNPYDQNTWGWFLRCRMDVWHHGWLRHLNRQPALRAHPDAHADGRGAGGLAERALRQRPQGQLRPLRCVRRARPATAPAARPTGVHPAAQIFQRPIRRTAPQTAGRRKKSSPRHPFRRPADFSRRNQLRLPTIPRQRRCGTLPLGARGRPACMACRWRCHRDRHPVQPRHGHRMELRRRQRRGTVRETSADADEAGGCHHSNLPRHQDQRGQNLHRRRSRADEEGSQSLFTRTRARIPTRTRLAPSTYQRRRQPPLLSHTYEAAHSFPLREDRRRQKRANPAIQIETGLPADMGLPHRQ